MNADEARQRIVESVKVTDQLVEAAVEFAKNETKDKGESEPVYLRTFPWRFAEQQGFSIPEPVVVPPADEANDDLRQVSGYYSCAKAMGEAISTLLREGYFVAPQAEEPWDGRTSLVYRESNGVSTTGVWLFHSDISFILPEQVHVAPPVR
jgi:hypothetical protein